MLALERRNQILARLMGDGKVVVSDLSRQYKVTEETIRRDLDKLEQEGYARKTYGGAVRVEDGYADLPYRVRSQTHVSGKQHMARLLASQIADGDYIALDSSSSALFVARELMDKKRLTLITNSVELLGELAGKTDWNILSTGGMLKENGLSLIGHQAERMIASFHVNWAILSCKGLSGDMGFTDSNEPDAQVKKAFISASNRTVFAVDQSKFDKRSFVQIAPLEAANLIVTDHLPAPTWRERLEHAGITLLGEEA